MRTERIIEARTAPRVLASPLAVLLTERIHAEWEIARDGVLFPEEMIELAVIVQTTLDEQKNLVSRATGRKNEAITPWYAWSALILAAIALALLIAYWR